MSFLSIWFWHTLVLPVQPAIVVARMQEYWHARMNAAYVEVASVVTMAKD